MPKKQPKILLVRPSLLGQGGVANYYKAIEPHLLGGRINLACLEIGSVQKMFHNFHFLKDQVNFYRSLNNTPDLVHINPSLGWKSFIRDGLFIWQAKKKGIKVLVFFHGWDEVFAQRVETSFLSFLRSTYGKADAIIVLASEFKNKLRSWGIKAPIYIQTTAMDENLLCNFDIKARIQALRERKVLKILYLARLERDKGIFETIDAIKILAERKIPVRLTIAGDGPARKDVEGCIKDFNKQNNSIQFLGYIRGQDKAEAFTEHDIYCLPSYREGMPCSVLEAIAFGLPIITCPVGGLKDIFQDGEIGTLVPPGDPVAIADAIEKYHSDREVSAKIVEHNFRHGRKFYASKVVQNILTVYEKTLYGPKKAANY